MWIHYNMINFLVPKGLNVIGSQISAIPHNSTILGSNIEISHSAIIFLNQKITLSEDPTVLLIRCSWKPFIYRNVHIRQHHGNVPPKQGYLTDVIIHRTGIWIVRIYYHFLPAAYLAHNAPPSLGFFLSVILHCPSVPHYHITNTYLPTYLV